MWAVLRDGVKLVSRDGNERQNPVGVRRYHRKDCCLPLRCLNCEVGISMVTNDGIRSESEGTTVKTTGLLSRCINHEVGISTVTSDNIGLDFDGITFKVDGQHAEPGSGWKGKVEMTGVFLFCVCNSRI